MSNIVLKHVYKRYPNLNAVTDFNLEIKHGEFVAFVGPSGCGKTTTLRMIAGLEEISDGDLYIDGVLCNNIEPSCREIAFVFQNYALFPQMTVGDNIAFGLYPQDAESDEVKKKVEEAARLLGISSLLERYPAKVSSGQRQRTALGRALVSGKKNILLDEPLSNLDHRMRENMRREFKRLHDETGATFILVSHNIDEAAALADRIVIMRDGVIMQVGSGDELYYNPRNLFVATFVGHPVNCKKSTLDGREVWVVIHPEDIEISASGDLLGVVYHRENLGGESRLFVLLEDKTELIVSAPRTCRYKVGDKISLAINHAKSLLFDAKTEDRIYS